MSHPAHRKGRLGNDGEVLVKQLLSRATPVSTILEQVHNQLGLRLKARDIYNLRAEQRWIDLVDTTAIQWLVETLGERDFFMTIDKTILIESPVYSLLIQSRLSCWPSTPT
jgi:hypothetical protein